MRTSSGCPPLPAELAHKSVWRQVRTARTAVGRGGVELELGQDVGGVFGDSALGEIEPLGDGGVGQALGHQRQYRPLSIGQVGQVDCGPPVRVAADVVPGCTSRRWAYPAWHGMPARLVGWPVGIGPEVVGERDVLVEDDNQVPYQRRRRPSRRAHGIDVKTPPSTRTTTASVAARPASAVRLQPMKPIPLSP